MKYSVDSTIRPKRCEERGAVLVMAALWLVALLSVAALAVDLGVMYAHHQQLQNVADSAALAGAGALREGSMDANAAKAAILATVAANSAVGKLAISLDPDRDIVIGVWNSATKSIDPWNSDATQYAVQVTARRTSGSPSGPFPTILAGIFGKKTVDVSASAIAGIFVSQPPRLPLRVIVVQDMSGSFVEEWSQATDADKALLDLINGVSIAHDGAGLIGFNDQIKTTTYHQNANRSVGNPRKTDEYGATDTRHGVVRQVSQKLTDFDTSDRTDLSPDLNKGISMLQNDNTGGNTDPAPAIDWATDQFTANDGYRHVIVMVSDGMPNPSSNRSKAIAAANRAGDAGIRIHTITLTNEPTGGSYGTSGSDFEFNKSLVRNGGLALQTSDPDKLKELLVAVGSKELSPPSLLK